MSGAPQDRPGAAPLGPPYRHFALVWSRLLFGGVLFVSVIGLFAAWSTFAEITTHFRAIYTWGAFFAVLLAVPPRHWKLFALSLLLLAWQLAGILPWYAGSVSHAAAHGTSLKILTANVSAHNRDFDRLHALVKRENPDLFFVQELSPGWVTSLKALQASYPYSVVTERHDFFGMALYSRFPIENARIDDPVGQDVPIIRADIDIEGRIVHVVNVHLSPPEGPTLTHIRLLQYPWLTEYAASLDGPVIVAGDFNCTMWSPLYTRLARDAKLLNARKGFGIMPTWLHFGGPLYLLPLDHVLVGGGTVQSARLGGPVGSDHSPFVAEIVFAAD